MKAQSSFSNAIQKIALCARWACAAAVFGLMAGCASGPGANPADPFEPFNRSVFRFNDGVDEAVLRPVATAYRNTFPLLVRTGVNNFFGNLGDVWNFANSVMQLRLQASAENFMRFNVNTLFGLGGLLDIATEAGIERHNEDFGQTLGRWGVPTGPYLVLPLLGPSTVRDASVLPIDRFGDSLLYVDGGVARWSLLAVRVIDARSNFLRASQLLDDAALDKYSFTRDAHLQRRLNDVYDGNPPGNNE